MGAALFELFSREHPALVHVPLGMVVVLPIMLVAAHRSRYPQTWRRMAFRVGLLALGGSLLTLLSGFYWARLLSLIPSDGYVPVVASRGQALQRVLRLHELTALAGFGVGVLNLLLLRKSYHEPDRMRWTTACLAGTILWAGTWGYVGRLGGVMVFGNAETNKAAQEAIDARKNDAEAELPVRALDYASLEPLRPAPFRSRAHGGRLARTWVTASGSDALAAGKPLPIGAYAVMSTDANGSPGPLYMREAKADGTQAFSLYWPRIPEAERKAFGGEDAVYLRSPAKGLESCATCHR
ncbi:hypothetical protein [Mesoterricola silvestris]|uniref:Uncharacterized protein n=1 Tax=Mesoterricola silvestris TaxID=2927979 RepID=A0AA48GK75_9BACT|nr:hypothetical protein [Mesoterricola silvestris]BDU71279.1 hypothetical protein METEAL_04530 [Mesoterricola silvestris]